jgi:hypothetical protein
VTPTPAELGEVLVAILTGAAGGSEERWREAIGEVAYLPLATHVLSNWSVEPNRTVSILETVACGRDRACRAPLCSTPMTSAARSAPENCWPGMMMSADLARLAEAEFLREHMLDRQWCTMGYHGAAVRAQYGAPPESLRDVATKWAGAFAATVTALALIWPLVGWALPASLGTLAGLVGVAYALAGLAALIAHIRMGEDRWRESAA